MVETLLFCFCDVLGIAAQWEWSAPASCDETVKGECEGAYANAAKYNDEVEAFLQLLYIGTLGLTVFAFINAGMTIMSKHAGEFLN